ncbi:oligosaccharide flippase family protein [Leptolyngbya sp. 15MV]|nr:oligosaccharide flippase family protein [Leptolyngbya sp. 15MV]
MSYAIGRWRLPSFAWDRRALVEILHFGKWIFFSTAIYFAAISTDKLYFIAALPLAVAGVYAIARTFADLFDQLAQRAGALLIFPRLAALGAARGEAAEGLRRKRRLVLAGAALAIALALAVSDQLILLLYDDRYRLAAFMLPILFVAVWFRVLGSFADAMLMGCSRPAPGAFANSAKFIALVVGLPLAIAQANLFVALLVLVLAEVARWAVLAPVLQRERLATILDDVLLTLLAAGGAVLAKLALGWTGLVPTVGEWWEMGRPLHG